MIPSKTAVDFIKKWEQCRLEAYEDVGGIWTIGWGTTGPGIQEGLKVGQNTADAMLLGHVKEVGLTLTDILGNQSGLNQNQFDALTSFCYNTGTSAFRKSTMLKLLKVKDFLGASEQFMLWNHVGGKVVNGLTARRQGEKALFLSSPLP